MTKLLIHDKPLQLLPQLAVRLGLNEAIVLQQLHWLLLEPRNGRNHQGTRYIYNTYDEWRRDHFPFWSAPTLKRIFGNLEKRKLVKSIQPERKRSRRKWYVIDYAELEKLEPAGDDARKDHIDPIGTDQLDPFLQRQRRQQKIPPTPGKDSGGFDSLPGELAQTSRGPRKPGASSQEWAEQATADPAGAEFLALAGMESFPDEGRQPVARKFVKSRLAGHLAVADIRLVAAMRESIEIPEDPLRLLDGFAGLVSDARDVARVRLEEIAVAPEPRHSSVISLLQEMRSAEDQVAAHTPDELFDSGVPLLMPCWVAMTIFARLGVPGLERWRDLLRPKILREVNRDAGILPFLNQINQPVEKLGFSRQEVDDERRVHRDELEAERVALQELLAA